MSKPRTIILAAQDCEPIPRKAERSLDSFKL